MRPRSVLIGASASLALVLIPASAVASASSTAVIRPGVSIGKLRLGMTLRDVEHALGGRAHIVNEDARLGFGGRYLELDWKNARWTVGFRSRRGALRAVRIVTTVGSERTTRGVGVGSLVRDVVREFPAAVCIDRWRLNRYPGRWIVVAGPGTRQTAFHVVHKQGYAPTHPGWVAEVLVQERWRTGSELDQPCFTGWERR